MPIDCTSNYLEEILPMIVRQIFWKKYCQWLYVKLLGGNIASDNNSHDSQDSKTTVHFFMFTCRCYNGVTLLSVVLLIDVSEKYITWLSKKNETSLTAAHSVFLLTFHSCVSVNSFQPLQIVEPFKKPSKYKTYVKPPNPFSTR